MPPQQKLIMYSKSDMRRAYEATPDIPFEEWLSQNIKTNEPSADALNVIDAWQSKENLPKLRKVDDPVIRIVDTAVKKYGVDECLLAIDRYSQMLADTDYYMSYLWDIRKFFRQSNAAPDFMEGGVKWINYQKDTSEKRNKHLFWGSSSDNHPRKNAMRERVRRIMNIYREMVANKVNVSGEEGDVEFKRKMLVDSLCAKAYPAIFATVAKEHNIVIDVPIEIPSTIRVFKIHWDDVVEMTKDGKTEINRYKYKAAFDALNLS